MVKMAFYRGDGTWVDRLIRWRTGSEYSHCEVLLGGLAYSASARDGGVRSKAIEMVPQRWDVIQVPAAEPAAVLRLFGETSGRGYDWMGVLVGQTFAVRAHSRRRWWCSEWCAAALQLREPWRYSPGSLADVVRRLGVVGEFMAS